jgi:hypothetical protein
MTVSAGVFWHECGTTLPRGLFAPKPSSGMNYQRGSFCEAPGASARPTAILYKPSRLIRHTASFLRLFLWRKSKAFK